MLIGKHDDNRTQAAAPEPGLYTAVIRDAVYYEPAVHNGKDLPGCVKLTMDMRDANGQVRYTDRIYLRESTLWRLHQLHHALGLTEPLEIEKFVSILPGMHVGVQITRAGQYTRVRFVPVKTAPAWPEQQAEEMPDDPLPF